MSDSDNAKIGSALYRDTMPSHEPERHVATREEAIGAKLYRSTMDPAVDPEADEYEAMVRGDEEIGGDEFDTSIELAGAAVKQLGTPALQKLVAEDHRYGSNPELVRFFARVGRELQRKR